MFAMQITPEMLNPPALYATLDGKLINPSPTVESKTLEQQLKKIQDAEFVLAPVDGNAEKAFTTVDEYQFTRLAEEEYTDNNGNKRRVIVPQKHSSYSFYVGEDQTLHMFLMRYSGAGNENPEYAAIVFWDSEKPRIRFLLYYGVNEQEAGKPIDEKKRKELFDKHVRELKESIPQFLEDLKFYHKEEQKNQNPKNPPIKYYIPNNINVFA